MNVGDKVLFQPVLGSMAREVGTVTAVDGNDVTIAWGGAEYQRDPRFDFLRAYA